ncbi:hypothetical protein SAMN05446935_9929 [Burkholderia sp. YR290]|nr:hypothetical protein SAMN05446935_9929 [Burkholderia sp. YR290]
MEFRYLFEELSDIEISTLRLVICWIAFTAGVVTFMEFALSG